MSTASRPARPTSVAVGRAVLGGARLSWALPVTALFLVGVSERGGNEMALSPGTLVTLAEIASAVGLALGVGALVAARSGAGGPSARRHATAGTFAAALVLIVTQVGAVAGAVAGRRAEEELRRAANAAVHDYGGWNGGARFEGAQIYALEIDGGSRFAELALQEYKKRFHLLLFGIDNTNGRTALALDPSKARAFRADGRTVVALAREDASKAAVDDANPDTLEPRVIVVPAGSRNEGALALFPANESWENVRQVEVLAGGAPVLLSGRFFALAEKRRMDAERAAAGAASASQNSPAR